MRFKRKNQITAIWVLGMLVFIYATGYFLIGRIFVPENFSDARNQSALVAKEIVGFSEQSLKNLEQISFYDRQYNFSKALSLVREELENTRKARMRAVDLAEGIGKMASAALGITPASARNLATAAAQDEVTLITHLIVYNDLLNALLQSLEFKFSGDIRYDSDEVQNLIKNMNQEAREINIWNSRFTEKMKEFDDLVR